ncbi:hypothetical protein [Ensifer sp. BR816]|nr:hypothetical protein [Ensifer sp. BR816]
MAAFRDLQHQEIPGDGYWLSIARSRLNLNLIHRHLAYEIS